MNRILDYIIPACLVLIPVLYIIGAVLKKAEKVPDKTIPLWLGVIGMVLAVLTVLTTAPWPSGGQSWLNAILAGVIQGVLCAGAAVYGNQIIKQASTSDASPLDYMSNTIDFQIDENDGDTEGGAAAEDAVREDIAADGGDGK